MTTTVIITLEPRKQTSSGKQENCRITHWTRNTRLVNSLDKPSSRLGEEELSGLDDP